MPTIAANTSTTLTIPAGQAVYLRGSGTYQLNPVNSGTGEALVRFPTGSPDAIGPFDAQRLLNVVASSPVEYFLSGAAMPFGAQEVYQDPTTFALVGAGGQIIARLGSAGDTLLNSVSVTPSAAAISTTVALALAIPVQSTKVRIAWQGRGSAGAVAGTARLNIACNRENLAAGLVASQDVRRRDYQLAAGEAVNLVAAEPITVVYVSANESVSINTHSIQISYEVDPA